MLFTNFSASSFSSTFSSTSASAICVSFSFQTPYLMVSWSADDHLENHNNGLSLERATWDFCSFLSCQNGMQDILWFSFLFLIRYERNIKRNSEIFPFSPHEMKYKELLFKKHAFIFPLAFWVHKKIKLFLLLFLFDVWKQDTVSSAFLPFQI